MPDAGKRKHPRFPVKIPLKLFWKGRSSSILLINAGEGGGFAKTTRNLELGSVIRLEFGKNKNQNFLAKVVHRQTNGYGLKFIDPPPAFSKLIPKPRGWLSFLKRNPQYQQTVPLAVALTHPLYALFKFYFNLQIDGVENIPYGSRFAWTQNHSGWMALDGPMIAYSIARHNPVEIFDWSSKKMGWGSLIRNLGLDVGDWGVNFWNNFAYRLPLLSRLLKIVHGFPISALKNTEALKQYHIFATPAEGEAGCSKSSFTQLYQLQRFHLGLARLALNARVQYILPTVILGPEESFLSLGSVHFFKKILGTLLPLPLLNFPIPVQWKISFLKPLDIRRYHHAFATGNDKKKEEICVEIMNSLKARIEKGLKKEMKNRIPFCPWFLQKQALAMRKFLRS